MAEQTIVGDFVGGDQITVGDITGSYTAIGAGAQVIVNHARSYVQELDERWSLTERRLAEAIQYKVRRYAELAQNRDSAQASIGSNPYRSLLQYRIEDAHLFYGRYNSIQTLLDRIRKYRLTILHAESGTGKSSLIEAGLAARVLTDGSLPLIVQPRNQAPSIAIKRHLLPNIESDPVLHSLAQSALSEFLKLVAKQVGDKTVFLFLDQFEEFFISLTREHQDDFARELGECLDDQTLNVHWLLSLRKEYFSDLNRLSRYVPNPFANEMRLEPFSASAAQEIIVTPAQNCRLTYAPGLPDQIIQDLLLGSNSSEGTNEAVIIPTQLQIVCYSLFEKFHSTGTITHEHYQSVGGAEGLLRNHLQNVLNHVLAPEQRSKAFQVLDALVGADRRRIIRSRQSLRELLRTNTFPDEELNVILDSLLASRLLRLIGEDEHGHLYELAHDYLTTEIKKSPEAIARTAAIELLEREVANWEQAHALMRAETLKIVATQRHHIRINEQAQELLLRSAFEQDEDLTGWLSFVPKDLAQHILLENTQDQNLENRMRAAKYLATFMDAEVVDRLTELARLDPDLRVRGEAIDSIRKYDVETARGILLGQLKTLESKIRSYSTRKLADFIDPVTTDALYIVVGTDTEQDVWQGAIETLQCENASPYRRNWRPLQGLPFRRQSEAYNWLQRLNADLPLDVRLSLAPARLTYALIQSIHQQPYTIALSLLILPLLYLGIAWWLGFAPFVRWDYVPGVPEEAIISLAQSPEHILIGGAYNGLGQLAKDSSGEWAGWMYESLPTTDEPDKPDDPHSNLFPITELVVNPESPNEFYIFMREYGMLKSVDQGKNWQELTQLTNFLPMEALTLTLSFDVWDNYIIVASAGHGLFASDDKGENWKQIAPTASLPNAPYIMAKFDPRGIPYVSTDDNLYRGESTFPWQWQHHLDVPLRMLAFNGKENRSYIAVGWPNATAVSCSTLSLEISQTVSFNDTPVTALTIDSTDPENFYVATLLGEIFQVSCNGSRRSLGKLETPAGVTDLLMVVEEGYLYQATTSGLFRRRP